MPSWANGTAGRKSFFSSARRRGCIATEPKRCGLELYGRFAVGVGINGLLLLPSRSNLILTSRHGNFYSVPWRNLGQVLLLRINVLGGGGFPAAIAGDMNWDRFQKLLKRYGLPSPRIVHSYVK